VLKALLTDIDGTLTGPDRRIDTGSILAIRSLIDSGTDVILASGNTACFMDGLSRMIGPTGRLLPRRGVFRIGFGNPLTINGSQDACRTALAAVQEYFADKGTKLELYSPEYRFADFAFARTVPADEVARVLVDHPVEVIDTGYAIHIHPPGITKGIALVQLAAAMGISPREFLAIGDSLNDLPMLNVAGIAVTLANGHPDLKAAADYVAKKEYGPGFVEAVKKYAPYFRAR
jgi:phosphoglycolate phosphatase (TIGR01487 family)